MSNQQDESEESGRGSQGVT